MSESSIYDLRFWTKFFNYFKKWTCWKFHVLILQLCGCTTSSLIRILEPQIQLLQLLRCNDLALLARVDVTRYDTSLKGLEILPFAL